MITLCEPFTLFMYNLTHKQTTNTGSEDRQHSQKDHRESAALSFRDNRSLSTLQMKMQVAADNSLQAKNTARFQVAADTHTLQQEVAIQRAVIKNGFGPRAPIIWDTEWELSKKKEMFRTLEAATYFKVLDQLKAKNEAEDVELVQTLIREKTPAPDTGGKAPTGKSPDAGVKIIHMNYTTDGGGVRSELQFGYLKFFATQAASIGLQLEILTTPKGKEDCEEYLAGVEGLSYNITVVDKQISEWAEDSAEFLESGQLGVVSKMNSSVLEKGMQEGRKKRWGAEKFEHNKSRRVVPEGLKVNAGSTDTIREQEEEKQGRSVAHLRAYLEGGNMITAEDAEGKKIVLVGRDGVDSTAYLYQMTQKQVLTLIAQDFGLKPEQIIPVEQPGKFHLDMGLLVVGMGKVIVNDLSAEYEAAKTRHEQMNVTATGNLLKDAELKRDLTDQAALDLTTAGFTVIRKRLESGESFNFFNGEFVTGKDGKKYYITNGADEDKQSEFRHYLVNELKVVDEVRFAPKGISQQSLSQQGGVGCRIKGATIPLEDFDEFADLDDDFEIVHMEQPAKPKKKVLTIVKDTYNAIRDILKDGHYPDEKSIPQKIEAFKKEEPITSKLELVNAIDKIFPDLRESLRNELIEYIDETYTE